jgi:2'-5' RNA ligase
MRLFTGLDLPQEVVANLERLIEKLRPLARIQWSRPANLHITTKFIGEWPEGRLEELKSALGALPPRDPMQVSIRGVGFFPARKSPRVFWCGIEAPGLSSLAADTEAATAALGIAREERAFSPHLTLARFKERIDLKPLWDATDALVSADFGAFDARRWFLYRSQLSRSGSVYTKLSEFPFAK